MTKNVNGYQKYCFSTKANVYDAMNSLVCWRRGVDEGIYLGKHDGEIEQ